MTISSDRWRFYRIIEEELIESDKFIPVNTNQLNVVISPKFAEIIIQASIHVESLLKAIALENGIIMEEDKTFISKLRELFPELSKNKIVFIKRLKDEKAKVKPFEGWPEESPDWWDKYTDLKHDIYRQWKMLATYEMAIKSLAALLICNFEYEIGNNPEMHSLTYKDEERIKLENVDVTYPIWISLSGEYEIQTDFFRYTTHEFNIAFEGEKKILKYKRRVM